MMIELVHEKEISKTDNITKEVNETVFSILRKLDNEYGTYRNKYEDNGGYVVVVEKKEDFKEIMDKTYIDCNEVIAEYVDKIVCNNGEVYTNSLILCNNDYAISLIIPLELTPQNLKDYIID